jgi:hypothetical protein
MFYDVFDGTEEGITFNNLVIGVVLFSRGTHTERTRCLYSFPVFVMFPLLYQHAWSKMIFLESIRFFDNIIFSIEVIIAVLFNMLDINQQGFVTRKDIESLLLLGHELRLPDNLLALFKTVRLIYYLQ